MLRDMTYSSALIDIDCCEFCIVVVQSHNAFSKIEYTNLFDREFKALNKRMFRSDNGSCSLRDTQRVVSQAHKMFQAPCSEAQLVDFLPLVSATILFQLLS